METSMYYIPSDVAKGMALKSASLSHVQDPPFFLFYFSDWTFESDVLVFFRRSSKVLTFHLKKKVSSCISIKTQAYRNVVLRVSISYSWVGL